MPRRSCSVNVSEITLTLSSTCCVIRRFSLCRYCATRVSASGVSVTVSAPVADTPEALTRVAQYLQSENRLMTQQVLLNVKVISVTLTDQDRLGIDWNLVYKTLSGSFGVHLKNALQTESGGLAGSVGI